MRSQHVPLATQQDRYHFIVGMLDRLNNYALGYESARQEFSGVVVEDRPATATKQREQPPRTLDDRCAALKAKMMGTQITSVNGVIKEVPLSAEEAAPYWGQSPEATRRYFREIPGVRIIPSPKRYDGGRLKRAYESLLIPPSILWREIQRTVKSAKKSAKESNRRINQAALTTRTPPRQT